MSAERSYEELYSKFAGLTKSRIEEMLRELEQDMDPFKNRVGSEGFVIFNDSSINFTYAVLQELLEARTK